MSQPTFQLLEKLEQLPYFNELITSGVIGVNWLTYKQIFDFYTNEVKRMTLNRSLSSSEVRNIRRSAKTTTAEEFNLAESTVYEIIRKMS